MNFRYFVQQRHQNLAGLRESSDIIFDRVHVEAVRKNTCRRFDRIFILGVEVACRGVVVGIQDMILCTEFTRVTRLKIMRVYIPISPSFPGRTSEA